MLKRTTAFEWAMKNRQIILTIVVLGMGFGVYALMNMPRNEFPEFVIRQGVVVGVFPGATSKEVEEHVTTEIENYIFSYQEVNKEKTYSHSKEGMVIIYVELNDEVRRPDEFWATLRLGLQELKLQLPSELIALIGTNDFSDTSALLITMSSDKKSYRELEDSMKQLEAQVRRVPAVSKIKRFGEQKEKVFVYFNQEKLNEYAITPPTVMGAFKSHEMLNYAGKLETGNMILPVHLPPQFESEKDLEELVVYSDPRGNQIRLKDVARVVRKYDAPESFIRNNGNNSLLLSLEMQPGNNIAQFGDDIRKTLKEFERSQSDDLNMAVISDLPSAVEHSVSHFMKELTIAVLAVVLVTMLLLPIRVASVAAITIPISILMTMAVMLLAGIQLDMVSLAGLIVVLGMVVDNAIVVIDNHVEKVDSGISPWDAAWTAAQELFVPVLSATLAIFASFFPLMLFLTGMAGDFVGFFPWVIGIALGISLLVAMFLVPLICYVFIKKGLHKKDSNDARTKKRPSLLDIVQNVYNSALSLTMRFPKTTVLLGVLSIGVAVLLFGQIKMKMFPDMERNQFAVEVYLPEGSAVPETERVIDELEKRLQKDSRVTNVAAFVGTGSPRFHTLYAPHMPAPNYGQIIVNTQSNDATVQLIDEYDAKYTHLFPNAHVYWKQLSMQATASPIEVRVSGQDIRSLKNSAHEVEAVLRKDKDITWVRTDWQGMQPSIKVKLNKDEANRLGYARSMVAASLMTSLDGLPVGTMWEDDYPVEIVLSREDHATNDVWDVEDTYVASPMTMNGVPLRSISTLEPQWTEGTIVHRNGVRTITVQANVKRGVTASNVFNRIRPKIDGLDKFKEQSISYGGEYDASIDNYTKMGKSLAVSVLLIFLILLVQFKDSKVALLIMATMPLSLLGGVAGLLIAGYPFGFTSFLGLMGLFGITVRNGIIFVDYALYLHNEEGYSIKNSAIAAGRRRMRPIFLTSMAAAMGVVPMIFSGSPLWGPLGSVICLGLIVGMIMTLLVLPALYWKIVKPSSLPSNSTLATAER